MADMAELIEPLIPPLRRYARSFLKDAAAADDLVQDSLERAISRWHQRRLDSSTRTWLFTILHNLAINRLRQHSRRGWPTPLEDAKEADLGQDPTQENDLRHQDILAAVDRLVDDHRSILLLISVEDLSYAEAAEVLGVPIGTVMSRLARARARLLQIIEEDAAPARSPARSPAFLRRVK